MTSWLTDSPRTCGIHEVFAALVPHVAALDALRTEEQTLTYAQVEAHTNRLARLLQAEGVRAGERVALYLDRSATLVLTQLAVLKCGATCVPIDVNAPPERVAFFLDDAAVRLVLCGTRTTLAMPESGTDVAYRTLNIEALDDAVAAQDASPVSTHVAGDAIAYVLYTSGSTGKPKGVLVPHRGVIRLVRNQTYFPAGPGWCTLLLASPGFDGTNYEIWSALLNGGAVAVFADRFVDHARLGHVVQTLGVTNVWFSTGLFNQVLDKRPDVLASLKHVLVGGEALSAPHMRRAMALLPQVQFANGYGPTECATFAVAWTMDPPDTWGIDSVPLGWPLAQTECWIVDEHLQPVVDGEVGELLLGGDGLALGYLNRPELTAERFIVHPFAANADTPLYRTGDRCWRLPSGMIGYVGRNDDQVKLNGFRVELGEVEAALRRCEGVVNAAVVVHQFPSGARTLVAGVVLDPKAPPALDAVQTFVASQLPHFMRPARTLAMDALPLTLNGKVDRRKLGVLVEEQLAAAQEAPAVGGDASHAPRTPLEEALVALWREHLRIATLHAESDFFHEGGDSLLAADLEAAIEGHAGKKLAGGVLQRHGTPRLMAAHLGDDSAKRAATPTNGLIGTGTGVPLFWMPDMIGYGRMPKPLAAALAHTHPIYDRLQFTTHDHDATALSIEDIATELVAQIRDVQADGPYALAGFSFGGYLALEVARQLTASGARVSRLVLWDTLPENTATRRSTAEMAVVAAKQLLSASAGRDGGWVKKRVSYVGSLVKEKVARTDTTRAVAREGRFPASVQYFAEQLVFAYRPGAFDGATRLICCTETSQSLRTRDVPVLIRWQGVLDASRTSVIEVACAHNDVFDAPHLAQFVQATVDALA